MSEAKTCLFDVAGMATLRRALRCDPEQFRRVRNALLKTFASDAVATEGFIGRDRLTIHALTLEQRHESALDGATKLLLRTGQGQLTETVVLRIATGRCTVCVSSQIGCAAACQFCATGTMGIARSLSTAEILDQVLQAGQLLAEQGSRLRNVVFMGMGEPFHNEANVHGAVDRLLDPAGFHLSPSKILVSTVGVVDGMLRFAERFPRVGLALSLHSVEPDTRRKLIPLAKKNPLPELRRTVVELNRIQGRGVMLEYLMLQGVNDSDEDADALVAWTDGLDVHINVIPYNPIDDAPHLQATPRARVDAFAARLRGAGRKTTRRHSLGRDIEAACGQLVKRSNLRPR